MKYKDKVDIINELCEQSEDPECQVQLLDGFEGALIGYHILNDENVPTPLYDGNKMVDILIKRDHMTLAQATEYIDFNVIGAIPKNNNHYPKIVSIFRRKRND